MFYKSMRSLKSYEFKRKTRRFLKLANINVRIGDEIEIALKKEASILGVSLSDLVRERLTGEMKSEPLNQITIENRIERLEEQQKKLAVSLLFQTRFLYQFTILAENEEAAVKAWSAAEKEINEGG